MFNIIRNFFSWIRWRLFYSPPLWDKWVKRGTNVHILDSTIDCCYPYLITIGNNVTITHATILAHDASTKKILGYTKVGRVDIGNNVFIGAGAIVLCNTRIGNNVIVGAGTVVAKDVPDNVVIAGNPWHVICSYSEYMERNRIMLTQRPISNIPFAKKTPADKRKQFYELNDFGGGFDI